MDVKTKSRLDARARIIKSMSHPSRLFIMEELAKGERCVQELTDMLGADMSTVSKHLSVLRNAGIVSDDKRCNQVFYSLKCPCIMNFFGCIESVIRTNAQEQMDDISID